MNNSQGIKDETGLFSGLLFSEELRQQYVQSGWLVSIPLSIVPAHWLYAGEQRLDGGYYAQEAITSRRIILDSKFPIVAFKELVLRVWYPNRFKRIWSKPKFGVPFLGGTEILHLHPKPKFISKQETQKIDELICSLNSILVTRSGSVGRVVLANKTLSGKAISEHVIRVETKKNSPFGYFYAFLSCKFGQSLLIRNTFGSAVSEIEPHHIESVPVPLIPENEQKAIHETILHVYALRDEANKLLDKAEELLHDELSLPIFDESLVSYLPVSKHKIEDKVELPHPKAFSIKASDLMERFDGSYHVPIARMVVDSLKKGIYQPVQLYKIIGDIFLPNRFKRIYVQKEFGIPFLQGSHLPQMRPNDLKYLSKKANEKNIEQCLVHQGQILLTRSGTIGRIALVSSKLEGWGGSEHLIRIIPNQLKGHSGYIAAYLMSAYGQHQLLAKTYGAVVDEITTEDTGKIWIPDAPLPIQEKIGKLVFEAFEKKDEASSIEENTIRQLEQRLEYAAKNK